MNRSWFDCYVEARTFIEVHGHFPTQKVGRRLNGWAMNWWRNIYLKNPELYQDKADMLRAIGFEYICVDDVRNEKFMNNYQEAESFFNVHGRFPLKKENTKLRNWAMQWWRSAYLKNPELYQEKADMLTAIGFEYKGKK